MNCQQRNAYPLKICFRTKEQTVTFSDEGKEDGLPLTDLP